MTCCIFHKHIFHWNELPWCVFSDYLLLKILIDICCNCVKHFHALFLYGDSDLKNCYMLHHNIYTGTFSLYVVTEHVICRKTRFWWCLVFTNCAWILDIFMDRFLVVCQTILWCCSIITWCTWIFCLFMDWLFMSISAWCLCKLFFTLVTFLFYTFMHNFDMCC